MTINKTCLGATPRKNVHGILLAAFFIIASPGLAAVPDCTHSTALGLDAELYGYSGEEQQVQHFRLEIPTPGIVSLDVTTPGESPALAGLDLSRGGCGAPGEATILEQAPTHLVLAVRTPGIWFFRAVTREPGMPLGPYKLVTRFVAARVVEETFSAPAGRPTGDRIDVTRFYSTSIVAKSDPVEIDPDPGTPAPPPPPTGEMSKDFGLLATVVTQRGSKAAVLEQVIFYQRACVPRNRDNLGRGLGGFDDHGDTMGCSTPVALGQSLTGKIGPAGPAEVGHDDDIFELNLTELVSLDVATQGETDTFGVLYDRFGQRLAIDDDSAEGRNFRIVKVLAPGRYFVRVGGSGGARGAYELSVTARGW